MQRSRTKSKHQLSESELILNPDKSIYHLNLRPEHIGDRIILVGDQGRVEKVSRHFERVEAQRSNREFLTHTGIYNGERVSVIATGIGTDNIDIVLNELDALINVDLEERVPKARLKTLDIVRIGTCGALQEDIPVDSFIASRYGLGVDGLLHFYGNEPDEEELVVQQAFNEQVDWPGALADPYFVKASSELFGKIGESMYSGITVTANGFYGPQGRELRLPLQHPGLNDQLREFKMNDLRITNFEMETSALYGLGSLLGHRACTVCAVIANRFREEYSQAHDEIIDRLIQVVLDRFTR